MSYGDRTLPNSRESKEEAKFYSHAPAVYTRALWSKGRCTTTDDNTTVW